MWSRKKPTSRRTWNAERKFVRRLPKRRLSQFTLAFLCTLCLYVMGRNGGTGKTERETLTVKQTHERAANISEIEPPFEDGPKTIYSMGPPDLTYLRAKTAHMTLWLLPGPELRCEWQYNYFCKFFHAIRCNMLGGFSRVRIAPDFHALQRRIQPGDVALIPYRSKAHEEPDYLNALNSWRFNTENRSVPANIRVGIFHVSNEQERTNWPWYPNADFILRNYWLDKLPPHVKYIPLHHQMPSFCLPESPLQLPGENTCACQGRSVPKASSRPLLYSFSGSLRHKRHILLRKIRKSKVLKLQEGLLLVSKTFGGDRIEGEDPKTRHVSSILDSMFVFAPCGNVMETHRIYEAIALGAIPVIQNCEDDSTNAFFPYREIMFDDHPSMVAFVEKFVDKDSNVLDLEGIDALQENMLKWWNSYSRKLAEDVVRVATTHVPAAEKWAP